MSLKVVQVHLSNINPAPYNPRAISEKALSGLKESITRFGLVDPLIVNSRNMVLVGGHQRMRALQELGRDQAPCVMLELSEAQEKALNVTLNNTRVGGFFTEDLQSLLSEIKDDLGQDVFAGLNLGDLEIPESWGTSSGQVEQTEENLDGIEAVIRVKCSQEAKSHVLAALKQALDGIPGVTVG